MKTMLGIIMQALDGINGFILDIIGLVQLLNGQLDLVIIAMPLTQQFLTYQIIKRVVGAVGVRSSSIGIV